MSESAALGPEFLGKYLSFWTRYEPMDRLLEAWVLAKPLSQVHAAIVYHHAIQHLGPEPEEMKLGSLEPLPPPQG
jgi:hypothetical protein